MIRLDYIKWAKNYIVCLYEGFLYGYPSPRYLLEELDEVIDEYYQYVLLEGRNARWTKAKEEREARWLEEA
ncbi:hypothetical protein ACF3OH_00460 [Chryseomicrobium aureum]|uniref:hypothetical protein n=1 Tax=Chryseomicrobium aureum TaxID=1441723 RepID=UPI00370CFC54